MTLLSAHVCSCGSVSEEVNTSGSEGVEDLSVLLQQVCVQSQEENGGIPALVEIYTRPKVLQPFIH